MNEKDPLTELAIQHYVASADFNGLFLDQERPPFNLPRDAIRLRLHQLIQKEQVVVRFGENENPFIKSFPDPPIEEQLKRLSDSDLSFVVVYPSAKVLNERVDRGLYSGRPFSLRLALGEAQMGFHSFDLSVLECYRNDPRYYYHVDDIFGWIGMKDEHCQKGDALGSDDVFLKTFGFSYDENFNRSVAVYTRYLHDLSPEHQQIWNAKRINDERRMHPDYYRSSVREPLIKAA